MFYWTTLPPWSESAVGWTCFSHSLSLVKSDIPKNLFLEERKGRRGGEGRGKEKGKGEGGRGKRKGKGKKKEGGGIKEEGKRGEIKGEGKRGERRKGDKKGGEGR